MKKELTIAILLMISCAAPKEVINPDLLQRTETISAPGQTKDRLYVQVNTWMVEVFESAESVIEFSDKEAGRIVGNYVFVYGESFVRSVIQIDVEDDRCKVVFKQPRTRRSGQDLTYREIRTNESLRLVNDRWQELAESLRKYLVSDTN